MVKNGIFGKVWDKMKFLELFGVKIEFLEILCGENGIFGKFGRKMELLEILG